MPEEVVPRECPESGLSTYDIQNEIVNNAVELAEVLGSKGFDDIMQDYVNDLIDGHSETLRNKSCWSELMLSSTIKEEGEEEEEVSDSEEEEKVCLTFECLSDTWRTANELEGRVEVWDPYMFWWLQLNSIAAAMQTEKKGFTPQLLTTTKKQR